ncbi:hypothetical protein QA612_13535 [Evansella sp. AB-P1]|uniref:hypothetical protein n=1 Tax=Evansella sp. AB-P1 TaxID=3037653 RepID=UPI00241CE32A|nr:hypothetical protein [Evansella sp. AB-P1]MDG5788505.1 hypothetical protein [Evansella sp. AB-P1]
MNNTRREIKLIIPNGCDNAPRKKIVIEFTVALFEQQKEKIKEYIQESIIWHQIKESKKIEGQDSFLTSLQSEKKEIIECLEIYQVITHGKFASINGVISYTNGTKIDFCDVYMFSNTSKSGKVKEIKSYRI